MWFLGDVISSPKCVGWWELFHMKCHITLDNIYLHWDKREYLGSIRPEKSIIFNARSLHVIWNILLAYTQTGLNLDYPLKARHEFPIEGMSGLHVPGLDQRSFPNGVTLSALLALPWWRHQMETFSALLALCAGNLPVTGEFPAQRPVTRGAWINGWASNREAGDLRRHCAHYDVTVMLWYEFTSDRRVPLPKGK